MTEILQISSEDQVSISPIVQHIRVYSDGNTFENRDPYSGILTIQYTSFDSAYISGGMGSSTQSVRIQRRLVKWLKLKGVKNVTWEHNGMTKEMTL